MQDLYHQPYYYSLRDIAQLKDIGASAINPKAPCTHIVDT